MFNKCSTSTLVACVVVCAFGLGWMNVAYTLATPDGSYTKSCRNIVDHDKDSSTRYISGECKNKNGSWVSAGSLYYRFCESGIWNDNGKLKCSPFGTFRNSCDLISWNSSFLTARCKRIDGSKITNSGFNYHSCLNDDLTVSNCDGSLQCGEC